MMEGSDVRLNDDPPSFLALTVDLDPVSWAARDSTNDNGTLQMTKYLEAILVFINSFLLFHEGNRIAVIGTGFNSSVVLYPSKDSPNEFAASFDGAEMAGAPASCGKVMESVAEASKNFFSDNVDKLKSGNAEDHERGGSLSSALSLALCMINRINRQSSSHGVRDDRSSTKDRAKSAQIASRIVCIFAGEDVSIEYVPIMNCSFSAQRMEVNIDSCVLADHESVFLQQASYITGGIYLRPKISISQSPTALAQYLIGAFLPVRVLLTTHIM
mmetsp:Transcript_6785/g.20581  ORF Transcript_6785/g.20581 Transcript_6785/m.20581 type:complete len:272 (-) Transcript_6785:3094-3909(-)